MPFPLTPASSLPNAPASHPASTPLDRLAALATMLLLCLSMASSTMNEDGGTHGRSVVDQSSVAEGLRAGRETVASGYVGAPYYSRSDLHLQRSNGTDMTLKSLGWDGDAFYFPIDGGARVIRWSGAFGVMVDFLHNKAITRLGKGTHGRKIKDGVVEDAETTGTLKGQPAPSPLHLTDLLDRLEFTHGHNVLLPTGLLRFATMSANIRPYVGVGFGVAVPHVEVRFTGEKNWTNEYQYAGPAFQLLGGLELRVGRVSYFIEYKFIWSSISAALTDGKSWSLKDLHTKWLPRWLVEPFSGLSEMPGDLGRQFVRWWNGGATDGSITTHLAAHEVVVGAGYVWPGAAPAGMGSVKP